MSYPTFAVRDGNSAVYLTDTAQRRILKTNHDGQFQYRIDGGSREQGRFFYANDLAVDEAGRLFVLNVVTDRRGFYVDREEILRFTPDGHIMTAWCISACFVQKKKNRSWDCAAKWSD
ncbi:hypothetical protein [Chromatium okenii]|uniref:SMP-30/Gluconolactonase/LRE-like region domain-containing protein n=1 Tax=Chromatium okenii TaxID=61644 RepID=A0A2S7XSX3_9GAMM|nr:hypothetical protein [Chromatium okenii]PQJ96512.1 hypothetical protein CXB77_06640 [Chromatium okenii]